MGAWELLWVLLAALAIWLVVIGSQVAMAVLRLMRMRFASDEVQSVGREEIPADIAAVFGPSGRRLGELGFAYLETLKIPSRLRCEGMEPIWVDIFRHADGATRAAILIAEAPEPGRVATVSFSTHFRNTALLTENRRQHLLFAMPPGWQVEDALAASLDEHWAFHQRRVAAENDDALVVEQEIRRRHRDLDLETFRHLQAAGVMVAAGDEWRLTAHGAYRFLRQVVAGNRRLAALPPLAELEDMPLRVIADRHAWVAQEAIQSGTGMSRRGKVVMFGLSALAGAAAFGYLVSWEMLPVLLGVLLFHEFGHALAMRAFGYRDLSVVVLPFLGAVAFGRKDDAGPWQKLIVLLAGPLPGLIVAVVCLELAMRGGSDPLLLKIGVMALVLNLFNLLPLTPLDGGQIVDTFLFARRPRFRFAFFTVSVLALIGIALMLDSTALAAAGVLLALGIPSLWRRLRMLSGIDLATESDVPTAIFKQLHAADQHKLPNFAARTQIVRLLQPLIRGRAPSLQESLFGLSAYLATIAVPIALLWHTGLPQGSYAVLFSPRVVQTAEPALDWDKQLAAALSPDERHRVHWEAGRWFEDSEDDEQARTHYAAALAETAAFAAVPGDLRRLDAQLALARLADPVDARRMHLDLLPLLRALPAPEQYRLAEVLEALDWEDAKDPVQRVAYLREAIAVRSAGAVKTNAQFLAMDRIALARLLDAQGNTAEAQVELQRMLDGAEQHFAWEIEPVAWFFLAHQQPGEAEKLLLGLPEKLRAEPQLVNALIWVALEQGRGAEARQLLESRFSESKRQRGEWPRLLIAVDLIHASGDTPGERPRWLSAAEASKAKMGKQFKYFLLRLRDEAESGAWESRRGRARLAAISLLPGVTDELKALEKPP
jgi:Zn-dependent protease